MDYALIKKIHILCVYASFFGFIARGVLRFSKPDLLSIKPIKIAPHIIDTLLLVSALFLASYWISSYPAWIVVKIVCLVGYVVLGMKALSTQLPTQKSAAAFVVALVLFGFMITVAVTKSPIGAFSKFV